MGVKLGNENAYTVTLKHSEMREVQLALLYHLDNVLIPHFEEVIKHSDYVPSQDIQKRISTLQKVLTYFNKEAGPYKEIE